MKMSLKGAIVGFVLLAANAAAAAAAAQITPAAGISGRWEVDGVMSGPWTFDLAESGGVITGKVWQHGSLLGHEDVLHLEGMRPRAAHSLRVPRVDDLDLHARDEAITNLGFAVR